jgi:hypothetical protein
MVESTVFACIPLPSNNHEWCIIDIPCPANALRIENSPCPVPIWLNGEDGAEYDDASCVVGGGGACEGSIDELEEE